MPNSSRYYDHDANRWKDTPSTVASGADLQARADREAADYAPQRDRVGAEPYPTNDHGGHHAMRAKDMPGALSPEQAVARRIVRDLVRHMRAAGWRAFRTWDGEYFERTRTIDDVISYVFNVDEISLRFRAFDAADQLGGDDDAATEHGVLLISGNGEDVLSDWNYINGDADGFNKAMEAFDVESVLDRIATGE